MSTAIRNTNSTEDSLISGSEAEICSILGGYRAIIERLDGVIDERDDRISELEAEVDRLLDVIREMS